MIDRISRALVVEDDQSWQQILTEILNDCGLQVDLAENYQQAVDLIRQNPHRLAVLDLSLGGPDHNNQDGLRVLDAVRRHDPRCAPIFLTGFATVELAVSVIQEHGAFTCLRKETFRRAEFRKVVNQALAAAPEKSEPAAQMDAVELQQSGQAPQAAEAEAALALVVEDDAGWRSLLSELLTDAGLRVRLSSSCVEALGLIRRESFQVAVLDLSLANSQAEEHNQDGYRLFTSTARAGIPTIVVSGYADPAEIERAYAEGHLFACLEKQAFDRKTFLETVRRARATPVIDPQIQSLTEREREVLELIARGMTNKEIAKALFITPNTVKRHIKALFTKLGVNTRSGASSIASKLGFGQR